MSKKRNKSKQTEQKGQAGKKKGLKNRWNGAHLTAAFLIGAMLGFLLGFDPTSDEGETTDAYGRSPDDPHYEHRHP
jgi:hypothetical protein